MDKRYEHTKVESLVYKSWEKKGLFSPEVNPEGKPFSIILPPPNANAPLHFGHAMYVLEDVIIRHKRMNGFSTLWLPGADHAGFETQYVFEKHLKEKGKSRFDYDREELFQMIWDFAENNRGGMENQLRSLGFSLDWSRLKFTMDEDIVKIVHNTFKQLYDDGLVYRDERLVNYCTFDGTSFSDLEVVYKERVSPLYYIKYGPLTLATTRPETKFGDTAVAVHPEDSRYKNYIGKNLEIETVLGSSTISVVGDEFVDPEFGTGVVKITPAHDFDDFEVAKRHSLPLKQVIGYDGKMTKDAGKFCGMYVKPARKAIVEEMMQKGLIEKIDEKYVHRIGTCYKCGNTIEPLPLEQWFVKAKPLAKKALSAVENEDVEIHPEMFRKIYSQFLSEIRDWNVSRQTVWGIQIPVFYRVDGNEERISVVFKDKKGNVQSGSIAQHYKNNFSFTDITRGIQRVRVLMFEKSYNQPDIVVDSCCPKEGVWIQETDTFDTWFSSGQWPFATLQTSKKGDFETFYPTDVMETGYDILRWWVARMVMLGIYATGTVPFRDVVLHGLVNDAKGKKMSKSKGNVVNPIEKIDEFGADAVRFALLYGTSLGHDQALSDDKLRAMRNFVNKLWNMGRFVEFQKKELSLDGNDLPELFSLHNVSDEDDKQMIKKTKEVVEDVGRHIEEYDFNHATQRLYDFTWHEFADVYIENVKKRMNKSSYKVLASSYLVLLKLLHPFMPFVTESIYQKLFSENDSMLIVESWPQPNV